MDDNFTARQQDISQIISALRLVLLGGLIFFLDFSFSSITNGEGFRFDILNDVVAVLILLTAIARLRRIPVDARYASYLSYVNVIFVLSLFEAIHDHFIYQVPPLLVSLFSLLSILRVIAIFVFTLAMRQLSLTYDLHASAQSWVTTSRLFVAIYLIPIGICQVGILFSRLTGAEYQWSTHDTSAAPLIFIIFILLLLPWLSLFITTNRMQHEAAEQIQ